MTKSGRSHSSRSLPPRESVHKGSFAGSLTLYPGCHREAPNVRGWHWSVNRTQGRGTYPQAPMPGSCGSTWSGKESWDTDHVHYEIVEAIEVGEPAAACDAMARYFALWRRLTPHGAGTDRERRPPLPRRMSPLWTKRERPRRRSPTHWCGEHSTPLALACVDGRSSRSSCLTSSSQRAHRRRCMSATGYRSTGEPSSSGYEITAAALFRGVAWFPIPAPIRVGRRAGRGAGHRR
jgi:hypothetical protein